MHTNTHCALPSSPGATDPPWRSPGHGLGRGPGPLTARGFSGRAGRRGHRVVSCASDAAGPRDVGVCGFVAGGPGADSTRGAAIESVAGHVSWGLGWLVAWKVRQGVGGVWSGGRALHKGACRPPIAKRATRFRVAPSFSASAGLRSPPFRPCPRTRARRRRPRPGVSRVDAGAAGGASACRVGRVASSRVRAGGANGAERAAKAQCAHSAVGARVAAGQQGRPAPKALRAFRLVELAGAGGPGALGACQARRPSVAGHAACNMCGLDQEASACVVSDGRAPPRWAASGPPAGQLLERCMCHARPGSVRSWAWPAGSLASAAPALSCDMAACSF